MLRTVMIAVASFLIGAFVAGYLLSFTGIYESMDDMIGLPATEWYISNYGPN